MPKNNNPILTGRHTRAFQDFFTPPKTAKLMAEHLRPFLRERKGKIVRILEPAAGSGNLLWPLIAIAREEGCILEITAIDVQQDYLDHIATKARALGFKVVEIERPKQLGFAGLEIS
jgi:hypothetical protein